MKNINKTFVNCFSLSVFIFFAGCNLFTPSVEDISEVALRVQTGLLGSTYTVSFANDGLVRCECIFYSLEENNKPNLDFVENICADLYRSNGAAFIGSKDTSGVANLKGNFTGKITEQEFENLAQIVRQSGFFSIVEKERDEMVLDAPPNFVKVSYEGKTKEVSDANNDLSEIEGAIIRAAAETKWEKEQK